MMFAGINLNRGQKHNAILPDIFAFRYFFSTLFAFISTEAHLISWETFSLSVHHSSFTAFAAQGGLVSPPARPYRFFKVSSTLTPESSLLQHVKERQFLFNVAAQAKCAKCSL
jgi:hypothetical protein